MSGRTPKRLARRLGWTVEPKRRSGNLLYQSPDGERYTSRAPGRADRVPLRLAKALAEAEKGTQET